MATPVRYVVKYHYYVSGERYVNVQDIEFVSLTAALQCLSELRSDPGLRVSATVSFSDGIQSWLLRF